MRKRSYILLLTLFFLTFWAAPRVRADSEKSKEYQIKAAFLYNFFKFIDWPKEKKADVNKPITIGIIGNEDFLKAFDPIKGKKINNRNISIKYFTGYERLKAQQGGDDRQWDKKMEALKVCHMLMFCSCDSTHIQNADQIMEALSGLPIVTVGESENFLKSGGMINFVKEDEKVCFEINNIVAKKAKLEIRSKLLRLAKNVIDDQSSNGAKK